MNGEMKFACSECGQHIACEVDCAGMAIVCPACATALTVPGAAPWAMSPEPVRPSPGRIEHVDRETWKTMGIGLSVAVCVGFVPFLNGVVLFLSTLVHELGHWLVLMAFGYPSVPAFSFLRGGFTQGLGRMPLLLLLIYACWGWLLWRNRGSRRALIVLGGLAAGYALMAHSGLDMILNLVAGHAAELVVASVFLYRAWSGSAILVPAERPLYATVGFSMAWEQFKFAFLVLFNATVHDAYLAGREVDNDFVRLNQQLGVPLGLFMLGILLCAILVPIVSYQACRHRPKWSRWLRKLLVRTPSDQAKGERP